MNKSKTCMYCGKTSKYEEYYIIDGWVKCPICHSPICNISIQDNGHWSKYCKHLHKKEAQ